MTPPDETVVSERRAERGRASLQMLRDIAGESQGGTRGQRKKMKSWMYAVRERLRAALSLTAFLGRFSQVEADVLKHYCLGLGGMSEGAVTAAREASSSDSPAKRRRLEEPSPVMRVVDQRWRWFRVREVRIYECSSQVEGRGLRERRERLSERENKDATVRPSAPSPLRGNRHTPQQNRPKSFTPVELTVS